MDNNSKSISQYTKDIEDELKNLGYRYTSNDTNIAKYVRHKVESEGKTVEGAILDFIKFEQESFEKIETINIVKRTCKELGTTYKELGDAIGYGDGAIKNASSTGKISEPMKKAIELYKKNLQLEKELENANKIKLTLKEWLK